MKLPSLLDLDLEDNLDKFLDEKEKKTIKQKKVNTPKVNDKSVDKPKRSSVNRKTDKENKKPKKKPIIPKSEYDSEGNPILAIPDLDDVDLTNEIDRFFGKGGN